MCHSARYAGGMPSRRKKSDLAAKELLKLFVFGGLFACLDTLHLRPILNRWPVLFLIPDSFFPKLQQ